MHECYVYFSFHYSEIRFQFIFATYVTLDNFIIIIIIITIIIFIIIIINIMNFILLVWFLFYDKYCLVIALKLIIHHWGEMIAKVECFWFALGIILLLLLLIYYVLWDKIDINCIHILLISNFDIINIISYHCHH